MTTKKLILNAFGHALAAITYIAIVATVMSNANHWFGGPDVPILTPIAVLSLLVLSATVMGALIFVRPAMWYVNGQKTEALKLFLYTAGWLLAFTVIILIVLAAWPKPSII